MLITRNLLEKRILSEKTWGYLALIFLRDSDLISQESFKKLVNNHKQGKFMRRVNTYYCPIDKRWHNDDSIQTIFTEIIDKNIIKPIELSSFLKYLNFCFSKNKNWCLDYVFYEIVLAVLNQYMVTEYKMYLISGFGIELSPKSSFNNYSSSCPYCGSSYHYDHNKDNEEYVKILKKDFQEHLDAQKIGRWQLNTLKWTL